MADGKSSKDKGATPGSSVKRPYATLDLKATEVKVTPVAKSSGKSTPVDASGGATPIEREVPLPAAASSYATKPDSPDRSKTEARMQAEPNASERAKPASSTSSNTGMASRPSNKPADPKVVVEKRGGFFSHLVAGIVGGILSFLALQWAIPELGLDGTVSSRFINDTASLSERIGTLEKKVSQEASASDLDGIEARVANLEKTAQAIPALTDSQRRLIAETKAALASAASDSGSTQLIDRVSKLEDKLKAMADAGVNDPNASRSEQLAGLTAKVSDIESNVSTQLASLRSSLMKDVDSRVQTATAAGEAAQTGVQRLDKDIAGIKTNTAQIEATANANKDATARIAVDLKSAQDQTAQLKIALDALRNESAKPAEIAAAVAPLAERTATLEKNVQQVMQTEDARQKTAGDVLLAIELQNLKRALDSGQKFSGQLAEIKKLAGNKIDLTALAKLQDTGVPTLADLKKDFRTAADSAMDVDATSESSGVVDRLWAEAKSVVRVRRIDMKPDDKSTEATLGRMQVALNDGRLSDALEASKDLPPAAQDAAKPFLDKLEARVSVDSTLVSLESQLKSSIAPGSAPVAKSAP